MTVSPTDTLRRAITELNRLRDIERAHATGDAREVTRLLAGCDPEELKLLIDQALALLGQHRIVQAMMPDLFGDHDLHSVHARAFRCLPGDVDESGGVLHGDFRGAVGTDDEGRLLDSLRDLSPGERALLREVRTVGP